ncbi:hypothetical protein DFP73DRAFT_87326 [Morchella snyderi]|nr:hypothetical protein DFP73DRAFT_87326 [Morchella snyderi]
MYHLMPAAKPPRPRVYTQEEWAERRSAFAELYSQDYTLATVRELMATNHGFYATEAQYKKKIKAWGLERNIDKATALGILRKEGKRKYVEDKKTIFKFKDNVISEDRVALLHKRYKGVLDHEDLDPHQWEMEQADTPPHVSYFTPPPVDEPPSVDYEILDQQVANGASEAALDCGETLDNKTQHGSSIKETSHQLRQSQRLFDISYSAPLIPGLEEQPIEINSSPDEEGNDNIELDVDLEDNDF